MTSLQTQALPQASVPLVEADRTFWRTFVDTGVSYFKWTYGGTFLLAVAYYAFRLFQGLWCSGNFAGFAGAVALYAAAAYGIYRLWRVIRRRGARRVQA